MVMAVRKPLVRPILIRLLLVVAVRKIFFMPKKGMTLLEIIVSCILLAICVAGMMRVFVSGKQWLIHFQYRSQGGELGKMFLDPLQMSVRQDEWNNSSSDYQNTTVYGTSIPNYLTINPQPSALPITLDNNTYSPTYTISVPPSAPNNQMRKAVVNITWPVEASPY